MFFRRISGLSIFQSSIFGLSICIDCVIYIHAAFQITATEQTYIDIDLNHLRDFDQNLYHQLVTYPSEVIDYLDMAVADSLSSFLAGRPDLIMDDDAVAAVKVRPFNANKDRNMRALDPRGRILI